MTQGYFLVACGKAYCDIVIENCIYSIRYFDKHRPICILTDMPDYFEGKVDNVSFMTYDIADYEHLFKHIKRQTNNPYEIYGLYPKLLMFQLTPFQETMFLDSDVMAIHDIHKFWDVAVENGSPIVITGQIIPGTNRGPPTWHWNNLDGVINACGFEIPQVSSGVVYWKNKIPLVETILPYYENYNRYNIKDWFRGSIPDEILIAIYMGKNRIKPVSEQLYQICGSDYYENATQIFFHNFGKEQSMYNKYKQRYLV